LSGLLRREGVRKPGILRERKVEEGTMIIAEVSIFPLGTGTPGVSEYVKVAIRELEVSGLKCTPGPMGTVVEAETTKEAYAAIAQAQAAVFELGAGRAYTVIKMDERRDVESRSVEDMMDSVRGRNAR
jgi:uncharacterized protein (TIGR00106 family)